MPERRRHPRYPFESHLVVEAPAPHGQILVRGYDISAGGFSFKSEAELRVGDRIVLGPSDDDFVVRATVRFVRPSSGGFVIGAERHL